MILSIVILSYNTPDLVINCLKSLMQQYRVSLEKDDLEIIIVDNASKEASVRDIKKFIVNHRNIKIVENQENLGFSRGCNLGAEKSEANHILFLNSDTQVKDEGLLKMVEFMKNSKHVGITGGKLLNFDGTQQPSAGKFYNLFNFFVMIIGLERLGLLKSNPKKISRVDWVTGACMMVDRKKFEQVGGFDENLFMYMEDIELCYRAKKNQIYTYFYPEASVIHKKQGSSNRAFAVVNIYKGILYFYKIHKPYWQYAVVKFFLKFKALSLIILGRAINSSYLYSTYEKALEVAR